MVLVGPQKNCYAYTWHVAFFVWAGKFKLIQCHLKIAYMCSNCLASNTF